MPRRSSGSKTKTKTATSNGGGKTSPTPIKPEDRLESVLDQMEREEQELMMRGYNFPYVTDKDKTPSDFAINPETGLFPSTHTSHGYADYYGSATGDKAWSVGFCDLRPGTEGACFPPMVVWDAGIWLSDIKKGFSPLDNMPMGKDFEVWLTSGNGTPGRFWFRAYWLPRSRAEQQVVPVHPVDWTAKEKQGQAKNTFGGAVKVAPPWNSTPSEPLRAFCDHMELLEDGKVIGRFFEKATGRKPVAKVTGVQSSPVKVPGPANVTKAPTLPAGVRFRCECGHWWKESDLAGHMKVCPVVHGTDGDNNWTVVCDDKCGCEFIEGFPTPEHRVGYKTLDHMSRCKPGFPPPKKEVTAVKETTEAPAEPESEPTPAEPTPEEGEASGTE